MTTPERTIADLVEARTELGHVAVVLRDAARKSRLNTSRLIELLAPLAERNGHRKSDGEALLEQILELAHLDPESISKQILKMTEVSQRFLKNLLIGLEAASKGFEEVTAGVMLESQDGDPTHPLEVLSQFVSLAADKLTGAGYSSTDVAGASNRAEQVLATADWAALAQAIEPSKAEGRERDT